VTARVVHAVAGRDSRVEAQSYPHACIALHHLWRAGHIASDVQDGLPTVCGERIARATMSLFKIMLALCEVAWLAC